MRKLLSIIILLVIGAVPLNAYWEPLDPVGGEDSVEVGSGGCTARGRGYTFVAIGDESNEIYAFNHSAESWEELEEDLPEDINRAGAMAYAHGNGLRLFVATDEENNLFIYSFYQRQGLGGYWNEDNPISLPEAIGKGVSLAYQPVLFSPPNPGWAEYIDGYLYLLVGNTTRHFWRRVFGFFPVAAYGLYPGNGSVVVTENLNVDWLPHPRWTEYNLQVSASGDFANLIIDTTVSCGEFNPAGVLFGTGTYYWRVRGLRSGIPSDWSETWCFTLTTGSGSVNFSPFPNEGLLIAGDEPVFDWQSVPDAASYWLQVAPTSDFAQPVIDVTTQRSEFVSNQPLESGTYYWRVCYRTAGGSWGNWSTPISFQVDYGWHQLPDIPSGVPVNQGGAMCYIIADYGRPERDTSALYVLVGNNSKEFWRFNLSAGGVWQECCTTNVAVNGGGSITSYQIWNNSDRLWALWGSSHDRCRTYDPSDNKWLSGGRVLPRACGYGSCIVRNETDYYLVLVIAGPYDPDTSTNFYAWIPEDDEGEMAQRQICLLYTSPSPRD